MGGGSQLNFKGKKVALIQGGRSLEKEVSYKSSECIGKALESLSCSYFKVEADEKLFQTLLEEKPDVAFLGVHGVQGEDGCLQGALELLKIPYTGSGVLTSALCMDKLFFKNLLLKYKIPTPQFSLLDSRECSFSEFPLMIKASHGGSTLGSYIVRNKEDFSTSFDQAQAMGRFVFMEKYVPKAKEVAVSYLGDRILTPIEIVPEKDFYDYTSKYESQKTKYILPARLDSLLLEKIKMISSKIISLTGVRGYGRIDFLIDEEETPWVLELNTLPGLTESSLLPKSAQHEGIEFVGLIQEILSQASLDYS